MKIKINQVEQLVLSSNQIYFVFPKKKLGCEGNLSKLLIQKASRNKNQIGVQRSTELDDYKKNKILPKLVKNFIKNRPSTKSDLSTDCKTNKFTNHEKCIKFYLCRTKSTKTETTST